MEVENLLCQIEDLKNLCKLGSRTPGHPENVITEGIEVTTGKCLRIFVSITMDVYMNDS